MIRRSLIVTVLCLGPLAAAPAPAKADSCASMLADFYNYVSGSTAGIVDFHHTTNYQTSSYWADAHAESHFVFASGNAIMSGVENRTWNDGHTDSVQITFYQDGTVYFDHYGPYTPTCYGNKFLVVNTGDSYETFTFTKRASSSPPPECVKDADCDDGNSCTTDRCENGVCKHAQKQGCIPQ